MNDTVYGLAGNDVIDGEGADYMDGGTEASVFAFSAGETTLNSASYDRIADYSAPDGDLIDLDFVDGALDPAHWFEAAITANNFAGALTTARQSAGSATRSSSQEPSTAGCSTTPTATACWNGPY